jgi:RHS repeat-associated protein
MAPLETTTERSESEQKTAASAISLPKGGGAIRGMGEKFAANPVTGTGSMTVPIATSPGRSGFGPQLYLSYDSGSGNGPFGIGWKLSLPSITRKTDKGLPQYRDGEESDVYMLTGAEDLVPVLESDGTRFKDDTSAPSYVIHRYRPRIEGLFARIERWTNVADPGDVHWRSISGDNILTLYGKDAGSRIADPEDSGRIFSWLICETRDDKGNAVIYDYKREDAVGVDLARAHERNRGDTGDARRTTNRYLKQVRYGNRETLLDTVGQRPPFLTETRIQAAGWMFQVVFDYGEHDADTPTPAAAGTWAFRDDPFSSYRAGFEVRTTRLCQRVLMFHHFEAEAGVGNDCLVRSTDFTYSHELDPDHARNPVYTFMLAVTQTGYKREGSGYLKNNLPPLEFEYTQPVVQDTVEEVDSTSQENLPIGLDGASYQWTDLHGEGIPGILTEQGGAWFYKRNLSPINDNRDHGAAVAANFAPLERIAARPNLDLAGGARFMDLAGDGQPDLVVLDGPMPGLYEHDGTEGWQPFRPFPNRLNRDTGDPNLKFVDLNGDGHADVLISEGDAFVWHPSLAEAGFGPACRVAQALDEEQGPRLIFADGTQSIHLADLSGDGLTDLVRIRNGEVCYWPNLGYARFGAKVTMDHAPLFDNPDQFDQKRIRLADIDGSGTTDIIYLHRYGVRLYFNQSGNSWSEQQQLAVFPRVDDLAGIMPVDLLGSGTACLVWSSSLPGDATLPMRYVNLMGGQKPHLLIKTVNNLGAETRVHYAPSTRFYLQDKYAGKPWITRLPFPVHVVERVETYDHVSRNRFVSRYEYHHGYFDGEEREFRGFGMVEQWDTEELEALGDSGDFPAGDNIDAASHVPPVHTKTWFHTGGYLDREHISLQFEDEYYREPGLTDDEFRALLLPDTHLPDGLTLEEEREACRALKGMMLRLEVYAADAGPDASEEELRRARTPYTVVEQDFTIRLLQPNDGNRHAVFFTHPREAITYHYERNPADPRIQHALTLEVDAFGNVLKEAAIGYGRRQPDASLPTDEDRARQTTALLTYTENCVTNAVEEADAYRTPLPCEAHAFELTGYTPTGPAGRFQSADFVEPDPAHSGRLRHKVADEIAYEEDATANPCRRLIERMRTLYRPNDCGEVQNDSLALLPLGELQSLALPGESYQLAFTPGLLAQTFLHDGQPLLPDPAAVLGGAGADRGGYVDLDGDGNWWLPSGRVFFSPDTDHSAAEELNHARGHFFLPHRTRDPFHTDAVRTESFVTYDAYNLLMVETRDALDNRVTVGERMADGTIDPDKPGNDYRVLQPRRVMDPNRNRSQVVFDALGMVVGTAVMGKPEEGLGDSLDGFVANLSEADILAHLSDPLAAPHAILGRATSRLVYDLFAYERTKADAHPQPAVVYTLARETHDADLEPGQQTKIQHSFSYSDGFGREIQQKIQAEPETNDGMLGPPRWVGSGWTIFNNKGNPVRQYEPFFSNTHRFEFGVQVGVSPVLFYDPLDRVVATLHPNNTYEKVVFDAWRQITWDVNDTVLGDPRTDPDIRGYTTDYFAGLPASPPAPPWQTWHAQRQNGALGAQEQVAAEKAAAHAATPATAHFDALGRPFLTLAHNGFAADGMPIEFTTRVILDIEGNQLEVIDALDRVVMRYAYDMPGNRIHQLSMEAGARWMLNDITGNPVRAWDSREHVFRTEYDPLRRPLCAYVTGADPNQSGQELLTERLVYGEQHPEAVQRNLRGHLYLHLDQAGAVTGEAHDFKGNPLHVTRRIAREYKQAIDWNVVNAVLPIHATDLLELSQVEAELNPVLESDTYISRTTYDALDRPITLRTPDNSVIRPAYNEANLLERVDVMLHGATAGGEPVWTPFVANIDYDAKGQRTRIDYGNGTGTLYTYDPITFRLVHLRTRRNADVFPDDCPQPAPDEWPGCQVQNLHYTYDPAGNIIHIRDNAQQTIYFRNRRVEPSNEYTYDALYRLIEATGREHLGQNGEQVPHSHNDAPRVGLPHPGDGNAMGTYTERYLYDAVGNFLQMQHRGDDPAYSGWTRNYEYDELSLIETGRMSNRLSNARLNGDPPSSIKQFDYDVHGNMIRKPHLSLIRWDYRDQLQATARQVVTSGGTSETTYYVYDAAGQRVRKVTERQNGTRKDERIYLGGFEIYREFAGNGATNMNLERETLHIMDDKQRIALVETRTQGSEPAPAHLIRYQFDNHLGSASLELDNQAQIISYEEYSPYGSTTYQAVRSQTEAPKRYRYTGKERDEESGLYYHGARYYAPWLGRWMSCDPLGLVDSTCLYLIVRSNPVRFVDSNGYFATESPVAPVPDIHIDPVTDPDLTELPSRRPDPSNPGARKPGPLGRLVTAILYALAKEAVPRFIDDLRRGHDRQEEGSGAFGNPTMRQPSFEEVVALGRLQSGTYHKDIGLPAEGEGIGIESRQGISESSHGPKEGVITYRINLREVDEDINDISEIMRQVQLQLYGFNDLLETEGGVDGIKVRILDYETDPAYRARMQKAKSDYLRILESTNPLPDNLKNRGYARLHNPDVAVGGYPEGVTAIGDTRINSILGSKYASIQDQILAMDSDVGWLRARIEFTNEKNEVAVFDIFDRGSRSWF